MKRVEINTTTQWVVNRVSEQVVQVNQISQAEDQPFYP